MKEANCPIAENFYKCEISLPIFTDMTEVAVNEVVNKVISTVS